MKFGVEESSENRDAMSRPGSAKGQGRREDRLSSMSPTLQFPNSIRFFSGNPSVETTEGIIHLYKDKYVSIV